MENLHNKNRQSTLPAETITQPCATFWGVCKM